MLLGTTARVGDMHRTVAGREHRDVLGGIGHRKLRLTWLRSLPRLARIAWNAARMTRRVEFADLPALKSRTVAEIRERHRIRPV